MPKLLFLTLNVFSATGGIEKMCRVAGKAFYEMQFSQRVQAKVMSMHDHTTDADDNKYFPSELFTGFSGRRVQFSKAAILEGSRHDIVVLSHINLLPVGWMIKKIAPKTRLILFAHGIEIWGPLRSASKTMLGKVDQFLCVSRYTQAQVQENHGVAPEKCLVLNNCLDPFLPLPAVKEKDAQLLQRYGFAETDIVLFTLTRLSSKDRYKGYDKVFEAIARLRKRFPKIRYLVGGGYDPDEKAYVESDLKRLQLQDTVVIAGFLPDEELSAHFHLADIYIMPSRKEGFGIVFIEAMFYGVPVIAGNIDGSVDALKDGELGILVNPDDVSEISAALEQILKTPGKHTPQQKFLMDQFSYGAYKKQLYAIINEPQSMLK